MGVCKERAWEVLNKISFERVTGTKEEKEAAKIIQEECKKVGVDAVIEEYEIDTPVIEKAFLAVTSPEYKEYHVIGIGKTGSTPDEGVEGPLAYIENGLDANLVDIEGKICLVQGRVSPELVEKMVENGAIGYVVMHGSFYDEPSLKEELRPRDARGKHGDLPGLVIHISDAEDLVKSKPESIKIILKEDNTVKSTAQNVVATIEGSDPKLKKEVVAFTAHYDSVRYSKGAWDNATGAINILELMHYYLENKPKRTVKFIWCGSEEIGLVGSKEYCKKHKDELKDYIFNINFDMTGVTLGYELFVCSASDEVKNYVDGLAKVEGYALQSRTDLYPSDSTSFATNGVPSCSFARLAPNGGKQIHNHYDTMDYLDADAFMITLNFVVTLSSQIVNAPVNMIPRTFTKELEEKIEKNKKMMEEDKKEDKEEKKEDK